jgi:histidinol-phosphate aminotransferase
MEPYAPIEPFEVLSARLGCSPDQIVKLDANENPYGPHPAVREALAAYPFPHIYPDPEQRALRAALADYTGVPADNILPGHGADELIDLLCRVFLGPGDAIINCPPTFGMYEFDAALAGAAVIPVRRREDFSVDAERIGEAGRMTNDERRTTNDERRTTSTESGVRNTHHASRITHHASRITHHASRITPKLLFLTSPNNPDGGLLAEADLRRLLDLPLVVVLDEAYIEFAGLERSAARWVPERENLIVLRTFSKWAGIAGLRLGYGIFPGWLMPALWKAKQPYNVNVAATVAGLASLAHRAEIQTTVDALIVERERLLRELAQFPFLQPYPSHANFVLCRVIDQDAKTLKEALAGRGILVRHYAKPGLENCIRVSAGRPQQTDALLEALAEVQGRTYQAIVKTIGTMSS